MLPVTRRAETLATWKTRLAHPVARNAAVLYATYFAKFLFPMATLPYLTRILTVEKFGALAFAFVVCQYFVTFTDFGFNFSATRTVAIHRQDKTELAQIYISVVVARMCMLLASFVILVVLVFSIPQLRSDKAIVFFTFLNVCGTAMFPSWFYQGMEQMQYFMYRELSTRALGLIGVFVVVRKPEDYVWVPLVQFGGFALISLASLLTTPRAFGLRLTRVPFARVWEAVTDAWPIFLSTSSVMLYTNTDTFLLGLFSSQEALGWFNAAQRLMFAGKGLVYPMVQVLYPRTSVQATQSRKAAVDFVDASARQGSWIFGLVSAGMLLAGPIAVPLVYGAKYAPAVPYFLIMSPIPLLIYLSNCYATQYMLGLGYKKEWSHIIWTTAVANFIFLGVLVPFMSFSYAVSITSVLVEVVILAGSYRFFRKTRWNQG